MQNKVLFFFERGQFAEAEESLNQLLLEDETSYVRTALKACTFWQNRLDQENQWQEEEARGDFLYSQWFRFQDLYRREMEEAFPEGFQSLRQWLFNRVIHHYQGRMALLRDSDGLDYLKVGRCYKFLGRYEEALPLIERALRFNRSSAEIMAEMADCYGLINEMELSKALFREAFYLDPQGISLDLIESPYMQRLKERVVSTTEYRGEILQESIPVFAVVYGIFDVKREMRQVEVGQLKQSVYSLKSELKESGREWKTIPRLLYRYFWLIDYYQSLGTPREKIQQILLEVQLLDPQIYQLYMS